MNEWLNFLETIVAALLFSGVYTISIIMLSIIIQNQFGINFWISMTIFIAPVIAVADKVYTVRSKRAADLMLHRSRYVSPEEFQKTIDKIFKHEEQKS